jgi:hypothetical protein
MKILWCWRCKTDVPMLDDSEFNRVSSLSNAGIQGNDKERMFALPYRNMSALLAFARRIQMLSIIRCPLCMGPGASTAENRCELQERRFADLACTRLSE